MPWGQVGRMADATKAFAICAMTTAVEYEECFGSGDGCDTQVEGRISCTPLTVFAIVARKRNGTMSNGDGWALVGPAAFKAVVGRAERLGCVRFARISAMKSAPRLRGAFS